MRRLILGAILVATLVSTVRATDEVVETAPNFHSFVFAAGADTTLKLADFDFDGDGKLDMSGISQVVYFSSAGADTLWYHADQGWWPNPLKPSTASSLLLRTKRFKDMLRYPAATVPAPADSTVLRYHSTGAVEIYLYVWGM